MNTRALFPFPYEMSRNPFSTHQKSLPDAAVVLSFSAKMLVRTYVPWFPTFLWYPLKARIIENEQEKWGNMARLPIDRNRVMTPFLSHLTPG